MIRDTAPDADLAPAPVEAWLAQHPRRVTAALLVGAIFVRLILCLQVAAGPLPRLHEIVTDSDNAFFDRWGRHLAAGEWLQTAPLHPTAVWMRQVADQAVALDPRLPARLGLPAGLDRRAQEERLWDHWLGGSTFYQEPAYAYLVGLTYRLTGPGVWHVFAWQLALGVLGVILVHELGRRLFSETAALAGAVLALLAPIPLFYEVTLLRDALVAYATLALALAMHWAPRGRPWRWLGLGLAFGAATLVKQSFLLFPLTMAAWRLATVPSSWGARLRAAGAVGLGFAAALLPLAIRNLEVGAPLLAMNGSATAMLSIFHTAGATPFDLVIPPDYARVLVATDGHPLASLVEAARTHPAPLGIVGLNLRKLLYTWHGFEAPNNVDFYLFRQGAPLLWALPATFALLLPLAAAGAASRRAARGWPLFVAVLASIPTMILGYVLSRYRAPITLALLPLAGAGAVRLASWIVQRRLWRLACASVATAAYLTWSLSSPPRKEPEVRARTYAWTGVDAMALGEPAMAALYFEESLRLFPSAKVEARLAQALLGSGDPESAVSHLRSAGRTLDSPAFHELFARALAATGRREEALAHARSAATGDPDRPGARELIEQLERGGTSPTSGRLREQP